MKLRKKLQAPANLASGKIPVRIEQCAEWAPDWAGAF
jgi:hypothetical protein